MKRIILAGGSGFIGRGLAAMFAASGHEVVILSRRAGSGAGNISYQEWDGKNIDAWAKALENAHAVINLAGHTINCPHTPANQKLIVTSRVDSVNAISEAIRRCQSPPPLWIQGSAVGFYGETGANPCDESSPNGQGFRAEACQLWEAALNPAAFPQTRCVTLRTGVVLGKDGGALPTLARLTRWFLGGAVGDGRQYISWIHQRDFNAIVQAIVDQDSWRGVFNATAPNPATNAEFMRELRRALRRPWSPPAPAFAVRLFAPLIGTDASLALESQRVVPRRLLESGFRFEFPELRGALADLFSRPQ